MAQQTKPKKKAAEKPKAKPAAAKDSTAQAKPGTEKTSQLGKWEDSVSNILKK
jgi:hypothetical protein